MAKLITKHRYVKGNTDFLDAIKSMLTLIKQECKYAEFTVENTIFERWGEDSGLYHINVRYEHQPRWIDIPADWFRECCCSECEAVILKSERTEICAECGAEMLKE